MDKQVSEGSHADSFRDLVCELAFSICKEAIISSALYRNSGESSTAPSSIANYNIIKNEEAM
jgi:hypothetical protein